MKTLSIRSTPYHQWAVESRDGRKRKVLGRFGDERNAKKFLAGLTKGSVDLDNGQKPNGHRARAGATPAASSILPSVSSLLAGLVVLVSVCAASGGGSISAGFSCAPEHATRAGAGMVAVCFCTETHTGFESLSHKTAGPADHFSVAAWIDTQRPHRSEPSLSPDSLGAQSERAVSYGWFSLPAGTSPTEFNVHPSSGFSGPASGLAWGDGVGNGNTRGFDTARPQPIAGGVHFSPAVGGNRTDLRAQRGLREETDVAELGVGGFASQLFSDKQVASGREIGFGCDIPSPAAPFLGNQDGAPSSGASKSRNTDAASVSAGENPAFPNINFRRLFAMFGVSIVATCGLLAVASCALSGRLEDPR